MRLKKVNLCWVLSEGRKGHEIQSVTLANRLASQTNTYTFTLRQPWETFAPRMVPGFKHGFSWQDSKPDMNQLPNIIITTGRKTAAMGKFFTQRIKKLGKQVKHIHILNPKDSVRNYDVVLLPEHDLKSGANVITFTGSIHPFSPQWFKSENDSTKNLQNTIAILIGNPSAQYFKQEFQLELSKIRKLYPNQNALICGSPRLSKNAINTIKPILAPNDIYWFGKNQGENPYQHALRQAKHLFVTSDSINMMNECAGSSLPVTLLAVDFIQSKKHLLFIDSLAHRWQSFEDNSEKTVAPVPYSLNQLLSNNKFQKLLN